MTLNSQIHSVALYFYFGFNDETKAKVATQKVVKKLRQQKSPNLTYLIQTATHVFEKLSHKSASHSESEASLSPWQVPEELDMARWQVAAREMAHEDLNALIWTKILEMEEAEVAKALNVTEGTIRYRCHRALRLLMVESEEKDS